MPAVVAAACLLLAARPVAAQEPPPIEDEGTPTESTVPPSTPVTSSLPPGCEPPVPALAVFVGRLQASDAVTARFQVVQLRAGDLGGHEVGGLVDVDYGTDVRLLTPERQYLVGVREVTDTGRLESKIRSAEPLFGGSQAIGLNTTGDCPVFEDAIRTLHQDGTGIDSGVIGPFFDDKKGIAEALVLPFVYGFLAILALAVVANMVRGAGVGAARLWRGEPVIRTGVRSTPTRPTRPPR